MPIPRTRLDFFATFSVWYDRHHLSHAQLRAVMWRIALNKLRPTCRFLSSYAREPRPPPPARPPSTPTMPIPDWPLDPRGEAIRRAKARRLGVNVSPRKMNLVARLVRRVTVPEAYRLLAACNKKTAPIVRDVITAAVRNARAYGLREDRLVIDEAWVSKGRYLARIRPWHGKGRFGVEHKKYAHLTVVVREYDDELWELTSIPQYLHFRRGDKFQNDTTHPIHRSEKVSWISDLDKGIAISNSNIASLSQQIRTRAQVAQQLEPNE